MSNRFYQKFFVRCARCKSIQRTAEGYKPIANPILFDSDKHSRNFFNERRRARGLTDTLITTRCEKCNSLHSNWELIDFQTLIDMKLSMTKEERQRLLWDTTDKSNDRMPMPTNTLL